MAAAALLVRGNARELMLVAALALVMHFFRDIAEPGSSDATLLWSLSDRVYTVEYGWYAGALIVVAAIALGTRTTPNRPRGSSPGRDTRVDPLNDENARE